MSHYLPWWLTTLANSCRPPSVCLSIQYILLFIIAISTTDLSSLTFGGNLVSSSLTAVHFQGIWRHKVHMVNDLLASFSKGKFGNHWMGCIFLYHYLLLQFKPQIFQVWRLAAIWFRLHLMPSTTSDYEFVIYEIKVNLGCHFVYQWEFITW